ncbi:MAG: hypothetical protein IMF19_11130, partial [Proteobacteria bacterium]|nr:hypothetical protein [Pseudomonadota bacterium]
KVTQHCFENDTSALGEHRLELVDPEGIKKIKLKEIKEIIERIDMLS